MRNSPVWFVIIALMFLLDLYVFQALRLVMPTASRMRTVAFTVYWVVSGLSLLTLALLPFLRADGPPNGWRAVLMAVVLSLFFAKLLAALFLLIDDIRRLFQWLAAKLFFSRTEGESMNDGNGISRSVFLTWLGLGAGATIFSSLMLGLTNKYNYKVRRLKLKFASLPQSFKGLRIVQLSDIHSGSFSNRAAVEKGIDAVLALNPDLILFTGDLVNNRADEMTDYKSVFSRLKAPMGVFSVLGNHDYGDYEPWPSPEAKRENLKALKQVHADMGWRLLLNEHEVFERNNSRIALLGIENWSAKARFPKYGRMADAYRGTEDIPFKILMSHDPSHWDAEVTTKYSDVDLMLAGHTHGMQFGVELPWLRWSPVQYVYKQWAGLYKKGRQMLYVNRGFGFIGYPGRVGILPEITLIELA